MTTPGKSNIPKKATITAADELLIQRCLDNELSTTATRQLMTRLDAIDDGWKTLACGFLEERLYKQAISALPSPPPPQAGNITDLSEHLRQYTMGSHVSDVAALFDATRLQASAAVAKSANAKSQKTHSGDPDSFAGDADITNPPAAGCQPVIAGRTQIHERPAAQPLRKMASGSFSDGPRVKWWAHPVTSITLCAAIAFVGGLLVPDLGEPGSPLANTWLKRNRTSNEDNGLAAVAGATSGGQLHADTPHGSMVGDGGFVSPTAQVTYSLQIVPTENTNARPVRVPVVDDPVEWSRGLLQEPQLPAHIRSRGYSSSDQRSMDSVRWIRLPVDDENDILMMVRDVDVYAPVQ